MLSEAAFEKCMSALENFYGGTTVLDSGIVEHAYYRGLKNMEDEQLLEAVMNCIDTHPRKYGFFPSVHQLRELAGCNRFPGETGTDYSNHKPALQSTEMAIDNLTDEERLENIRKIRQLAESFSMKKLRNRLQKASLDRIRENLSDPNKRFEVMRQMLLSDNLAWRQEAIAWGRAQPDVFFLYAKDGDVEPSDMHLIQVKPEEDIKF